MNNKSKNNSIIIAAEVMLEVVEGIVDLLEIVVDIVDIFSD